MIPACILPQICFIAIRAYAAHSYLYYEKDENIIPDHEYDQLCRWIYSHWAWIKPHDLNNYLDFGALDAGTGHQLKVTGQTRDYAEDLLKAYKEKTVKPPANVDPFS